MCQIDDELTTREASMIRSHVSEFVDWPDLTEEELFVVNRILDDKDVFRAYLDGLMLLPRETVKIMEEMEREKREAK